MKKVYTKGLLGICLLLLCFQLSAQEYRRIDGRNNNRANPEWGAANVPLLRMADNGYADRISAPGGTNRPNPRMVSNELFAQEGFLNDVKGLSDFTWVFGQFIDHDITFVLDNDEAFPIQVPAGDRFFDPYGTGQVQINMHRSLVAPGTGTSPQNPRNHINAITAFIDASAVYGSDEVAARWLRSLQDGKMKVSSGNMLPFNTFNGEYNGRIDPNAPHMDNPVGLTEKVYVAGDARANENPLLLAYHTLFVREHNRLCDELKAQYPYWNDERLYQEARKINAGILQSIVYNEWLPTMGVPMATYRRYEPSYEVGISNVFSAAAFRVGHTLLNGTLLCLDEEGHPEPGGNVDLRFAFFNIQLTIERGIEPFLQGMGAQIQQGMDAKVVDDVRNFLFGPPGAGGMDLAAINIQRGRERGLPDFNTVRRNLRLPTYSSFSQINNDPVVFRALERIYGDVNNIDPWVGMMAESPMGNSLFGETLVRSMTLQFTLLRDGDRFYYENDPGLSSARKAEIRDTRMVDVIKRNTSITLMQENVFEAKDMSGTCATLDVAGNIRTIKGLTLGDVDIRLNGLFNSQQYVSTSLDDGSFQIYNVDACNRYDIDIDYDDQDWLNGLTTHDMVMLLDHVLGREQLHSPFLMIAADVDDSKSLTTADIVEMQRVLLGHKDEFEVGQVWKFVNGNHDFENPNQPLRDEYEVLDIGDDLDIVAIKMGDLDSSVAIKGRSGTWYDPTVATLPLRMRYLQSSRGHQVEFYFDEDVYLKGLQFEVKYDRANLSLARLDRSNLPMFSANNFRYDNRKRSLKVSWVHMGTTLRAGRPLAKLTFIGAANADLCDAIYLEDTDMEAEVYTTAGINKLTLDCDSDVNDSDDDDDDDDDDSISANVAKLYENEPNPFSEQTQIRFDLPIAMQAKLSFIGERGQILHTIERNFQAGENQVTVTRAQLNNVRGSVFYRLKGPGVSLVRVMVVE
ncbi:MAG: peroxidase family protein [Bacteroidota bacterium]